MAKKKKKKMEVCTDCKAGYGIEEKQKKEDIMERCARVVRLR
jgi:hypothetical protein